MSDHRSRLTGLILGTRISIAVRIPSLDYQALALPVHGPLLSGRRRFGFCNFLRLFSHPWRRPATWRSYNITQSAALLRQSPTMENAYSLPPIAPYNDALDLLSQVAMQTQASDSPNSAYEQRPNDRSGLISDRNHDSFDLNSQLHLSRSQIPAMFTTATSSMRSVDTTSLPSTGSRQGSYAPFMNQSFQGIGSQISNNFANSLGILNAESYDQGISSRNAREASEARVQQGIEAPMPFGITSGPSFKMNLNQGSIDTTDVYEPKEKVTKKSKRSRAVSFDDDDEEARKKARGRPRVDTKDETAADVSLYCSR